MNEVTRILLAAEQGDSLAAAQLLPLVYNELRQLAAQRLAQEKPGQTLQATADRLAGLDGGKGEQFFDAARIYTLAATNAKSDVARGLLFDEMGARRERNLAKAVELLALAAKVHCFDDPQNRTSVKIHRDFVPLYNRDDFKNLLANIPSP